MNTLNFVGPLLSTTLTSHSDAPAAKPARAPWLTASLRTDHAGEYGAVWLYKGILWVSRDPLVIQFAQQHLETETTHLERMAALLDEREVTALLPLWKVAGLLAGAIPAVFGRKAVFATVDAVETFVDQHYLSQIIELSKRPDADPTGEMIELLYDCRHDELVHREEARKLNKSAPGPAIRAWRRMIEVGSHIAVGLSTRI